MDAKYNKELKGCIAYEICELGKSTKKTAQDYGIPLKTVEKWVTMYNKDPKIFDTSQLTEGERVKALEKEVRELKRANEILKKTLVLMARKE